MIRLAVTAVGLSFVLEGLLFALMPARMERLVEWLARASRDRRRALGLAAIAAGVLVVWMANQFKG